MLSFALRMFVRSLAMLIAFQTREVLVPAPVRIKARNPFRAPEGR